MSPKSVERLWENDMHQSKDSKNERAGGAGPFGSLIESVR